MAQRKGVPSVPTKLPRPRPTTGGTTLKAGVTKAANTGSNRGR